MSGEQPNPSPSPNPNPEPSPAPSAPAPNPALEETVSRAEFERVKNDMHKYKTEAQTAKEQADQLRLNGLKEKQDWKSIAEENERQRDDFREKYNGLNSALINNAKASALKEAGLRAGILNQSLDDLETLDFSEIRVETTSTGKILVSGADQAIENLKKRRPHWFGQKPASVNPASPELQVPENGVVTLQMVENLRVAYQKAPQDEAAKKAYSGALFAYKRQNP